MLRRKASISPLCGLLVAMVGCSSRVAAPLAPDTIVFNGKIVTVDKAFSIAEAAAIKNGRFIAVGSTREIQALAGSVTEEVDLSGKTVLPGFNDSHLHIAGAAGEPPDP